MPLQNRVTPFGEIIFSAQRGTFTGNRGVIHNAKKEIVRQYALKAWITCRLEYKNAHREVMTPNRWTELFFWDEATAFAAGHRPCAYCRNADFKKFKSLWLEANKNIFKVEDESMKFIDTLLHTERLTIQRDKIFQTAALHTLPNGVFIKHDATENAAYLWWQNQLFLWTEKGYDHIENFSETENVFVITPPSIVNIFKQKYVPTINFNL